MYRVSVERMIKSQLLCAGGVDVRLRQTWIQILPLPLAASVTW